MADQAITELDEQVDGRAPEPPFALTILHCPEAALVDRVVELPATLRIGRAVAELVIDDPKLSRTHVVVRRHGDDAAEVEDAGSTNGTFVGGLRVRRRELTAGTILRIGSTLFLAGPADPVPPDFRDQPDLVGRSRPLRALLDAIDRVAATSITVLVTGETGTGKELVAARLHRLSRRAGPLVAVNCGAIPAHLVESSLFGHKKGAFTDATSDSLGYFGAAESGTLLLDEVSTLPLELQPKLLRVLESRAVMPLGVSSPRACDVRVLSASNVDLADEVEAGRFRRDLYARLAEHVVTTPPLRHRRADIPLLTHHFLALLAPQKEIEMSAGFLEALLVRDYPMNVRELRAAIQHAVLHAGDDGRLEATILPDDPARPGRSPAAAGESGRQAPPREELEALLAQHRGNLAMIAKHYGRARTQIYRWLERYGLDPGDYR